MKHLAIIPAYNEEHNIERVLHSLTEQSKPLTRIVVVDDGSTDSTAKVALKFADRFKNVDLVQNPLKNERAHGTKIINAFNLGLDSIDIGTYDTISKLDADLEFPMNYFERIEEVLMASPKVALVGGCLLQPHSNSWKLDRATKTDHVNGAIKTYRASAFLNIGGLRPIKGWDTADEFLLRFHSWEILRIEDIQVKHHRPTFQELGWKKSAKHNAEVYKNLRYGFIWSLISSCKRGIKFKPFLLSGMATFLYYHFSSSKTEHRVSVEVGKFIRKYRWRTLLNR